MFRAPDLLVEYLAERDIACEGCGYNLRGATTVQCPECGRVIPRPPADFIAITRTDAAALRLFCEECGYSVTGAHVARCPECGSSRMARYAGESPPRRQRSHLQWLLVVIVAGADVVVLITCVSRAIARQAGARGGADPWIGVLICTVPLMLCGALWWWRGRVARLELGERKVILATLIIAAVVCIGLALRTL